MYSVKNMLILLWRVLFICLADAFFILCKTVLCTELLVLCCYGMSWQIREGLFTWSKQTCCREPFVCLGVKQSVFRSVLSAQFQQNFLKVLFVFGRKDAFFWLWDVCFVVMRVLWVKYVGGFFLEAIFQGHYWYKRIWRCSSAVGNY